MFPGFNHKQSDIKAQYAAITGNVITLILTLCAAFVSYNCNDSSSPKGKPESTSHFFYGFSCSKRVNFGLPIPQGWHFAGGHWFYQDKLDRSFH